MTPPTTDELRTLIVVILDKLNQLETLFAPLMHKAEAQTAMAEISAYRVTARGLLSRCRAIDAKEGGGPASSPPGDTLGRAGGAAAGWVNPRNFGENENSYGEARK